MDWSAQTNEIMKTWGDAQKQLWSGWMTLAQGANLGQGGADVRSDAEVPHGRRYLVGAQGRAGAAPGGQRLRYAGHHDAQHEHADAGMASGGAEDRAGQALAARPAEAARPMARGGRPTCRSAALRCRATSPSCRKSLFERWTPITAPWLSMVGQATAGGHPGAAFLAGTAGAGQFHGFRTCFRVRSASSSVGELPRATVAREKMGKFLKVFDALNDLQEAQDEYREIAVRWALRNPSRRRSSISPSSPRRARR